ncbi:ABC transporter permease [Shinella sp.]|uniref:ABC transporter permease n=1 Tax=Shinella sp. TaxID=1870904 RepID=UPI003F723D7E
MANRPANWLGLSLALPLPLLLVLAYLFPLAGVLAWSVSMPAGIGLGNFRQIATDPLILSIFLRTLRICTVVTLVSVAIAYFLAYHLRFGSSWKKRVLLIGVLIPFWLSALIRAFAWLMILRGNGLANSFLQSAGLITEPLALARNELGVTIGMVHFLIPYAVLPIFSSLQHIDDRLLQASRSLGAGFWRGFKDILLPLSSSGLLAATVIVFVFSLGFFVTPAVLGGGRVVMVAEYIYVQMFQLSNWGLGAALSAILMLIVVALMLALIKIVGIRRLMDTAS